MLKFLLFLIVPLLMFSCIEPRELSSTDPVNWEKRAVNKPLADSLETGRSFLSIYSQIYTRNEDDHADLTATVSLHNPNLNDQIHINKAVYYNTQGEEIRTYFKNPIFIQPMETVQIVIDGIDKEGGSGANFIFDWSVKASTNEPIFEAIMINTYGQQGISFVTAGKRIKISE